MFQSLVEIQKRNCATRVFCLLVFCFLNSKQPNSIAGNKVTYFCKLLNTSIFNRLEIIEICSNADIEQFLVRAAFFSHRANVAFKNI